jgi:hypothetical protein
MHEYKLECPHCAQPLEIPSDLLGQTLDCPSCGGQFSVPKPTPVAVRAVKTESDQNAQSSVADTSSLTSCFLELQSASNFRLVRQTLRTAGIGSIVFGLLAMFVGFGNMMDNPLNAILGMIGLFLVGEGIWIIVSPSPKGLVVDGIFLCALGAWNIFITAMNSMGGDEGYRFFGILGLWQVVWGTQSFVRYRRFSTVPTTKPADALLVEIDNVVNDIALANVKNQPDMVEIQTKSLAGKEVWKGRFVAGGVIFVEGSGPNAVFANKADVEIVKKGKVLFGKTQKIKCKLGSVRFDGTIAPLYMERLDAWTTSQ